jgi:hypothetical protein
VELALSVQRSPPGCRVSTCMPPISTSAARWRLFIANIRPDRVFEGDLFDRYRHRRALPIDIW